MSLKRSKFYEAFDGSGNVEGPPLLPGGARLSHRRNHFPKAILGTSECLRVPGRAVASLTHRTRRCPCHLLTPYTVVREAAPQSLYLNYNLHSASLLQPPKKQSRACRIKMIKSLTCCPRYPNDSSRRQLFHAQLERADFPDPVSHQQAKLAGGCRHSQESQPPSPNSAQL